MRVMIVCANMVVRVNVRVPYRYAYLYACMLVCTCVSSPAQPTVRISPSAHTPSPRHTSNHPQVLIISLPPPFPIYSPPFPLPPQNLFCSITLLPPPPTIPLPSPYLDASSSPPSSPRPFPPHASPTWQAGAPEAVGVDKSYK